ncbi:MAG: hypothetical protein PVG65_00150 [Candidatus Thorarchaeota archaeon]|jgi:hypothetical protein
MGKKKRKELKNLKEYYKLMQLGALFLKYIDDDLAKMEKTFTNRNIRRRWKQELYKKGKFSPEVRGYYFKKIDKIQEDINRQLNPPKPGEVKINKEEMLKKTEEK